MAIQELALKYNPKEVNLLVPTQNIQQVSPWHAVRISEVRANPDPDAGDVYKVGSRYDTEKKVFVDLYSPAKPLLMKVAAAAGIVWNWRESGPMTLQRDYVCWKAVGALRLPDGTWQPFVATKEIDLTVIEEEIHAQNLKKAQEYAEKDKSKLNGMTLEDWAQAQTRANMVQWRKNKAMRAETGAMLRVIRAALGMKSQYTREELEKPFIVPRIDFNPDYSDPEVRHILLQNGAQAMANLFGSVSPATPTQLTGQPAPFTHPAIMADEIPEEEPSLNLIPESEHAAEEPQPQNDDDTPPWAENAIICKGCACIIEPTGKWTAEQIAEYSKKEFGKELCPKCQAEARKAKKAGGTK